MLPDALGLFSTITGWPIASDSFGADQPRQDVGGAARRVGHDDGDLLGEILADAGRRAERKRGRGGSKPGKRRSAVSA